jgi:hypothetical protein
LEQSIRNLCILHPIDNWIEKVVRGSLAILEPEIPNFAKHLIRNSVSMLDSVG